MIFLILSFTLIPNLVIAKSSCMFLSSCKTLLIYFNLCSPSIPLCGRTSKYLCQGVVSIGQDMNFRSSIKFASVRSKLILFQYPNTSFCIPRTIYNIYTICTIYLSAISFFKTLYCFIICLISNNMLVFIWNFNLVVLMAYILQFSFQLRYFIFKNVQNTLHKK